MNPSEAVQKSKMATSKQDYLKGLMKRKDEIEAELMGIVDELESKGPDGQPAVGLRGKLVDAEGYPRNDIDIMRISTLRNRHAILNTDLAELMKEIEKGLHSLHADAPKPEPSRESSSSTMFLEPFLLVHSCVTESPAYKSGLRTGDLITKLGSLRAGQFKAEGFAGVAAQIVEDKAIRIHILRGSEHKTISLLPQKWSGDGLIGCHLVKALTT